jgi:hypothetical protein
MFPVQDDLVKDLVAIQVDRSTAHFAAKDGDAMLAAESLVYLLFQILMVAQAHIRLAWGQYVESLHTDAWLRVVDKL